MNTKTHCMVRRKSRAVGMGTLSLSIALALGVVPLDARAQEAVVQISIPAQPLGQALLQLGRQTSLQIFYAQELVQGLSAVAISGNVTPEQALRQLLQGTGIEYSRQGDSVTLSRSASGSATQLESIRVVGSFSPTMEGTGSYTATGPSSTATGLGLTLRETPQSVTVMTRQRMDDFNLHSLTDVLEQTPGVTIDRQGDANNFLVRGSGVNLQVDGARQMSSGWATDVHKLYSLDDMVEIDRIEVLKGSSGLINGDGAYGATVNMIRKRPTKEFQASIGAGAGSWDNYRTDVDIGGPFNAAGTVRGRLVAAGSDGKSFRDHAKHNNKTLFGTLEVDLTPDMLFNVGVTHRRRKYHGAGDTSMIQAYAEDGQYIGLQPRSFNIGAPWAGYEQESTTLFSSLEHEFSNGWTANFSASYEKTDTPYGEIGMWWTAVPEAVDVGWTRDYVNRNRSMKFDLKGPIELFGREHELLVGADTSRTSSDKYSGSGRLTDLGLDYSGGGGAIIRPDLDSFPMKNHSYFSSKRRSVYAAGRFNLANPVKLIAGLRLTDYEQLDITPYAYSNNDLKENGVVTPYAGLVVDVHENVSLYGSYASIFKPQSAKDAQGSTLDPEEGLTYEVGAKGEFFNKRLNASIAHFWMKTDNTAQATGDATPDGETIYRAVSGVTRRGYELELSGEISPRWQLQGSYVVNSSSLSSGSDTPKQQFKLATTYRFAGKLRGLTTGAAARWQSKTSAGVLEQSSFWLIDLMGRYEVDKHLSVAANVNNVFDKKYFAGLRDFGRLQYTWGTPRSVNVSMRYKF